MANLSAPSLVSKKKMLFRDSRSRISSFVRQTRRGRKTDWRGESKKIEIKKKFCFFYATTRRRFGRERERKPASRAWLTWRLHTYTRVRHGVCKTSRPRFVGWNGWIDSRRRSSLLLFFFFLLVVSLLKQFPDAFDTRSQRGKKDSALSVCVWKITRQTGAQRKRN